MTSDKPDNVSDPAVQELTSRAAPLGPPGTRAVLDASALLALLFAEPGAETVAEVIADGAVMSSVNLSEVATLLVRHGQDPSKTLLPVLEQVSVEAFTVDDALAAAQEMVRACGPVARVMAGRLRPQRRREPLECRPGWCPACRCVHSCRGAA